MIVFASSVCCVYQNRTSSLPTKNHPICSLKQHVDEKDENYLILLSLSFTLSKAHTHTHTHTHTNKEQDTLSLRDSPGFVNESTASHRKALVV